MPPPTLTPTRVLAELTVLGPTKATDLRVELTEAPGGYWLDAFPLTDSDAAAYRVAVSPSGAVVGVQTGAIPPVHMRAIGAALVTFARDKLFTDRSPIT